MVVNAFCYLVDRYILIFLEQDHTFIVLVEDRVAVDVALCVKKIVGPENYGHEVVGVTCFYPGGPPSIQLLFGGCIYGHTTPKRHTSPRFPPHIGVDCV